MTHSTARQPQNDLKYAAKRGESKGEGRVWADDDLNF
jgi:hypothetical protein